MPYRGLSEEDKEKQKVIDFNLTFSTEHGFRVLQELIHDACHMYVPSRGAEPEFMEGERNIGLYIMSYLNPELRSQIL